MAGLASAVNDSMPQLTHAKEVLPRNFSQSLAYQTAASHPHACRRYTASRSDSGAHHASILAAAASIMREEGPGGYYRGLRTKVGAGQVTVRLRAC